MIEVFHYPLYFAWRWEYGFPYVFHYYIAKEARSFKVALQCGRWFKNYFKKRGYQHLIMNAHSEDFQIQKAIEYFFRIKSYAEVNQHKFYIVEV